MALAELRDSAAEAHFGKLQQRDLGRIAGAFAFLDRYVHL
jgi:hypothetical protein